MPRSQGEAHAAGDGAGHIRYHRRARLPHTSDDRSAHMRLAVYCKQHCSPEIYRFAFQNRQKLPGLIDDVWAWETLEEDLATSSLSSVQRLCDVAQRRCVCG